MVDCLGASEDDSRGEHPFTWLSLAEARPRSGQLALLSSQQHQTIPCLIQVAPNGDFKVLYGSPNGATHWIAVPPLIITTLQGRLVDSTDAVLAFERAKIGIQPQSSALLLGGTVLARHIANFAGLKIRMDIRGAVSTSIEGRITFEGERWSPALVTIDGVDPLGILRSHVGERIDLTLQPILSDGAFGWEAESNMVPAAVAKENLRQIMIAHGMEGTNVGLYVEGEKDAYDGSRVYFVANYRLSSVSLLNGQLDYTDCKHDAYRDSPDLFKSGESILIARAVVWRI